MADQKISELTEKTTLGDTDLVPIVDIEATPDETKKITGANLRAGIKTIKDADGDTQIQTEESADEDKIRMDVKGVEAFLLDDAGILTLAKQSGARAYRSGTQSINKSTWTKVQLNAETYDIQNEFDSTTNYRFTATVAGYYSVDGMVTYAALADQVLMYAGIYKNGTEVASASNTVSAGAGGNEVGIGVTDMIYLAVGGYLELWTWHSSAAATNVESSSARVFMSVRKVA